MTCAWRVCRLWALLIPIAVFAPVLPGLWLATTPVLQTEVWWNLWHQAQTPRALSLSLWVAGLSTVLALMLALAIAAQTYQRPAWRRLPAILVPWLAMPHAAIAAGLLFLLAPSGWLMRLVAQAFGWESPPAVATVRDPLGLSLVFGLILKETVFLLWVLMATLASTPARDWVRVAESLGYSSAQAFWRVVVPNLLPRLALPLGIAWAYALAPLDMAPALGPLAPPLLASLSLQWLLDPDPSMQTLGLAAAWALVGLWLVGAVVAALVWYGLKSLMTLRLNGGGSPVTKPNPWGRGVRFAPILLLIGLLVLFLSLLVQSLARSWFFPEMWPSSWTFAGWQQARYQTLLSTVWLAVPAVLIALLAALLWLEWAPKRLQSWVLLPLLLPVLPLAAGQYYSLVRMNLDGRWLGVLWAHLTWVFPYTVLVLAGPYQAIDPRLRRIAMSLGLSRAASCWRVLWPTLTPAMIAAAAVGLSVSVAQYLPTLLSGAGRWNTVTTEAVTLSAGGQARALAVQSLLQAAIPALGFGVAALATRTLQRWRRGLA